MHDGKVHMDHYGPQSGQHMQTNSKYSSYGTADIPDINTRNNHGRVPAEQCSRTDAACSSRGLQPDEHDMEIPMNRSHSQSVQQRQNDVVNRDHSQLVQQRQNDVMNRSHSQAVQQRQNDVMNRDHLQSVQQRQNDAMTRDHSKSVQQRQNDAMNRDHSQSTQQGQNDVMNPEYSQSDQQRQNDAMNRDHSQSVQQRQNDAMNRDHSQSVQQRQNDAMNRDHSQSMQQRQNDAKSLQNDLENMKYSQHNTRNMQPARMPQTAPQQDAQMPPGGTVGKFTAGMIDIRYQEGFSDYGPARQQFEAPEEVFDIEEPEPEPELTEEQIAQKEKFKQMYDGSRYIDKARIPGPDSREIIYRNDGVGAEPYPGRLTYKPRGNKPTQVVDSGDEPQDTVAMLKSNKPIINHTPKHEQPQEIKQRYRQKFLLKINKIFIPTCHKTVVLVFVTLYCNMFFYINYLHMLI